MGLGGHAWPFLAELTNFFWVKAQVLSSLLSQDAFRAEAYGGRRAGSLISLIHSLCEQEGNKSLAIGCLIWKMPTFPTSSQEASMDSGMRKPPAQGLASNWHINTKKKKKINIKSFSNATPLAFGGKSLRRRMGGKSNLVFFFPEMENIF